MFARSASAAGGIFFKFNFTKPVDWDRTYVICANHSSNLDISVLTVFIKNNFAFLGKEELKDAPITGIFFRTVDIPLNRDNRISAYRAFQKAGEYLDNGISLAIFPEGMIADEFPPRLGSFKNGPFRLAIEKKIAILPISICDVYQLMWDDGHAYGTTPGTGNIIVHPPIETASLSLADTELLKNKTFEVINSALINYGFR